MTAHAATSLTVAAEQPRPKRLVERFAERLGVEPDKMLATLKATAFKQKQGDPPVSNEQMMALLVVADHHKLNPFTKEIYAFADKHAGIVPVVGVDGWARIINEHPAMNGMAFAYSEDITTPPDGKPCPEWCEVSLWRRDRDQPIIVREYLDEVYQPKRGNFSGPWQSHTKRFLRHKTLIQGARIAFGFAGIFDEDEAGRILDAHVIENRPTRGKTTTIEALSHDPLPIDGNGNGNADDQSQMASSAEVAAALDTSAGVPTGPTYAELAERIKTAGDGEIATLVLDEARGFTYLTDEDRTSLAALWTHVWGKAKKGGKS